MFLKIFAILILINSEIALGVSGEKRVPVAGAQEVGFDVEGNPIYRAMDLVPETRTMELRPGDEVLRADPQVYKGTKSIEGEFPAMGWIGNCTGTAVGPKVIFTASHCQTTGTKINFEHRGSGKTYRATCTRHPNYNDRTVLNDWTFCILDQELPAGTQFASFNTSGSPEKGAEMLMNGFGAPNVRVHYWGKAVVTGMQGQDIVTCGPANLGGGDSGGSLLRWTTDRVNGSKFVIEGVNSRGGGGCDYFNTTSSNEFKGWAPQFATDKGIGICGVNLSCADKPVDPNKCLDEQKMVLYTESLVTKSKERLALCLK